MSEPTVLRLAEEPAPRAPIPEVPATATKPIEPAAMLLTARQAAAVCGVSLATWERLNARARCPEPVRLSRGCVRWKREELLAWISANCPSRKEWEAQRRR